MAAHGQSTDINSRTEAIYVTGTTVKPGNQLLLSVQMKNEVVSARGFQFDLFLPDVMSFVKDENDKCKVKLSSSRTTGSEGNYLFTYNIQSNGALRVLCNAWDGTPFTGTSGEICTIAVCVNNDVEDDACTLDFRNIILTDTSAKKYNVDNVSCVFDINTEIDDILLYGDVNHDGVITVADIMILVDYVLGLR
jgi:hypothetical protein